MAAGATSLHHCKNLHPLTCYLRSRHRRTRELPLTLAKASQMAKEGFKFAEPEYSYYRLSKPYELVIIRDANPLTVRQ